MPKRTAVFSGFMLLGALLVGCGATPGTDDGESADELRTGSRLATANVDDVVQTTERIVASDIEKLRAAHPSVRKITRANVASFTEIGSTHYLALSDLIETMLTQLDQTSIAPSSVVSRVGSFVRPKVEAKARSSGTVKCTSDGDVGLLIYDACVQSEQDNAFARADRPRGVDFDALRSAWRDTTDGTTLDHALVTPVRFSTTPSYAEVRKAAGASSLEMTAFGFEAIDGFVDADETVANQNPSAFQPIARSLRGAIGIKKRYLFTGGGNGFSRHVLAVVDEKNQVWGFSSGYSE